MGISKNTSPQNENPVRTPEDNHAEAIRLYELGLLAWKNGNRAEAITLYNESAALDPNGPGVQALEMSMRIMNFYDKQQFNP